MVTINGGGGNGDGNEPPKSGGEEAFVGGGDRRDDRCISGSAVVGGKTWRRQGICKKLRATRYYSFLYPSRPSEEVKLIKHKGYKTKLKLPDDIRVNTVCKLCLLALSVLCWVFVRASFLQNLKKNLDIYC